MRKSKSEVKHQFNIYILLFLFFQKNGQLFQRYYFNYGERKSIKYNKCNIYTSLVFSTGQTVLDDLIAPSPAMYFITIFTFSSGFSFSLSDITMLPPCLTVFYFTVSHRGSISEREWAALFCSGLRCQRTSLEM